MIREKLIDSKPPVLGVWGRDNFTNGFRLLYNRNTTSPQYTRRWIVDMAQATLTPQVKDEITRLSETNKVDAKLLEEFAYFVVKNSDKKSDKTVKPLSVDELKTAIFNYFDVRNTDELKRSGEFKMVTGNLEPIDFRLKSSWELMYRRFIGILPHEHNQEGYGCINGIDVFKYFKPWQVFGLDSKTATKDDIKQAYYRLSKIYHPDNPETGDRKIFEQIEVMYKSIIVVF